MLGGQKGRLFLFLSKKKAPKRYGAASALGIALGILTSFISPFYYLAALGALLVVLLVVRIPEGFAVELVEKGSITIDGVSLTVAALTEQTFSVCLIPQTLADTALSSKSTGTFVNLEGDIIGKYVRRFLEVANDSGSQKNTSSGITYEKLREAGFL